LVDRLVIGLYLMVYVTFLGGILSSVNVSNLLSFGLFSDREKIVVAISLFLLIYLSLR